ncbi:hypothetical protein C4J81_02760 [Deltaproteobacteria bacterium Smac51]|nr:hypothetical protein C4J81_02760 [Deltaproteobacteria bacterium Smac51]
MNITCPNCRARSRIADNRVPPGGAWARCPGCQSRFFIRPPTAPVPPVGAGSPPSDIPLPISSEDLRQRILRRINSNNQAYTSRTPDGDSTPEIVVFPERAVSNSACVAMGLFILALPVILMWGGFKSASSWRHSPRSVPVAVGVFDQETLEAHVVKDLLYLRRHLMDRSGVLYSVNYSGSEVRVFKYYLNKLAPEACGDITHIKMESSSPSHGLTATATCLDSGRGKIEMKIGWVGRSALISFPQYDAHVEVELFSEG